MAIRPYFLSCDSNQFCIEKEIEFKYFSGFAISQKIKSVQSLHEAIKKQNDNLNLLEVSTKSENPIGYRLSAFNLQYTFDNGFQCSVENVFQASKVFENNTQYVELLHCSPREAKKYEKLKTSGKLVNFRFKDVTWQLEPKTAFYDYLYISALLQNKQLSEDLMQYDAFTDIEFNPLKSYNCQARSVAIFVSLQRQHKLYEYIKSKESFLQLYSIKTPCELVQMKLF